MKFLFLALLSCIIIGACISYPCELPHPLFLKFIDIQGHRGGKAYYPQNTLPSFANGIQIGENTLEMDLHITKDGYVVVSHDHDINPDECKDTKPVTPGDKEFPYAGKFIVNLTLAQIRTLDCGNIVPDVNKTQKKVPGTKMPLFTEVIDLVKCYGDPNVMMNPEIKYNADAPEQTATREQFVTLITKILKDYKWEKRVTIQSFDWTSLVLMKKALPNVLTVALVDETTAVYNSTWLNNIDIYDPQYSGSIVKMAHSIKADILSPIDGFNYEDPVNGTATTTTTGYFPYTTKAMVDEAHSYGMKVVPWTVNDRPTMKELLLIGVDGIISNNPLDTIAVAKSLGYQTKSPVPYNPKCYQLPKGV